MSMPSTTTPIERRQVFISYAHAPAENAAFVRDLAGRLRVAGFEVWLDEEQIPGAANIREALEKAIEESEIGLFIVTSAWVKRDWTQYEVELFGMRKDSRRLAVIREEVDLRALGPYLIKLKHVEWKPNEEEWDARFWEIYCGINDLPPGPREFWSRRALEVTAASLSKPSGFAPATAPQRVREPGERIVLPCSGRPVRCVVGKEWTFIVTDHEEWIGIGADGNLHPALPRLSEHAGVAFGSNHELLVGMYEPLMARLRNGRWEYLPQEAPVLCFANGPEGDILGNAAGGLVAIDASPLTTVRVRDPVIQLEAFEDGLIVLGSRGSFGRLSWPLNHQDSLRWINADELGRPVGLFSAVEYNQVGLYSATRIGVLNAMTEELRVYDRHIEDGIREVTFLGARSQPYAVLTDAGGLWLVDAGLGNARAIRLPRDGFVRGCTAAERPTEFYVWTNGGELYAVYSRGGFELIAADGVVLAYCPSPSLNALHLVRWQQETGATLELLPLE
jgi:hypothetical protein